MDAAPSVDPLAYEMLNVAVEEGWLNNAACRRFIEMYGAGLTPDFVRVMLLDLQRTSREHPEIDDPEILLFGDLPQRTISLPLHRSQAPRRRQSRSKRNGPRPVDRRAQEKLRRMRDAHLTMVRGGRPHTPAAGPDGDGDVLNGAVNHDLTVSPTSEISQTKLDQNAKKVRSARGRLVEFAALEVPVAVLLLGQAADQIAKMELSNLADGIVLSLGRPTL